MKYSSQLIYISYIEEGSTKQVCCIPSNLIEISKISKKKMIIEFPFITRKQDYFLLLLLIGLLLIPKLQKNIYFVFEQRNKKKKTIET